MIPANIHMNIQINLYTQGILTSFSQPWGHLQVCKVQRLDTLKVQYFFIILIYALTYMNFAFYIPQDGHMAGRNV